MAAFCITNLCEEHKLLNGKLLHAREIYNVSITGITEVGHAMGSRKQYTNWNNHLSIQ